MGDCEQAPMEQPAQAQASKKGGRLKKLRKWVARGDVYNKARLDECVAAGLALRRVATTPCCTTKCGTKCSCGAGGVL